MEIQNPQANLKFCQETVAIAIKSNLGMLTVAKRLAEIRDKRLYEPNWSSFDEFTMDAIKYSKGTVSEIINIHKKYVESGIPEDRVATIPWSVLARTLPLVKTKNDAEYWIDVLETSMPSHARQMIKDAKTGVDSIVCDHKNMIRLAKCEHCGYTHQVFDDLMKGKENEYAVRLQEAMDRTQGIEITYREALAIINDIL